MITDDKSEMVTITTLRSKFNLRIFHDGGSGVGSLPSESRLCHIEFISSNFMINQNESDLHRTGIQPRSLDSQSNTLPIELDGRYSVYH